MRLNSFSSSARVGADFAAAGLAGPEVAVLNVLPQTSRTGSARADAGPRHPEKFKPILRLDAKTTLLQTDNCVKSKAAWHQNFSVAFANPFFSPLLRSGGEGTVRVDDVLFGCAFVEVLVAVGGLVQGDHIDVNGLGDLDFVVEDRVH